MTLRHVLPPPPAADQSQAHQGRGSASPTPPHPHGLLEVQPAPVSFPPSSVGKESACSAGDLGSIPGSGRSPGGQGTPLQYSCLENPMDGGAWRDTVHGVTRVGQDLVMNLPPPPVFFFVCLWFCLFLFTTGILAWRIPWTGEPGGLQSLGGGTKNWTRPSTHTHACPLHQPFKPSVIPGSLYHLFPEISLHRLTEHLSHVPCVPSRVVPDTDPCGERLVEAIRRLGRVGWILGHPGSSHDTSQQCPACHGFSPN